MIRKLEHLGIAVKNLTEANVLYERLLGKAPYKTESVESEGVSTSFFEAGETKIELLQATRDDSAIYKFVETRGEGLHHIAFEVDDIMAEMTRLEQQGFHILSNAPFKGADNKMVCFVHPKSAGGVLVELCQEITG
jgi:methylmalonyl-CoA/ethylmalonyl-CoA epimerase